MKPEAQRIAIAEACGWTNDGRLWWSPEDSKGARSGTGMRVREGNDYKQRTPFPDYLNDLNAMHEAVRSIPDEQQPYYMKHLFYVLIEQKGGAGVSDFDKHLASASVCAEAFLKTIGQWKKGS